jgi:UDP-glucose 4-epimerase
MRALATDPRCKSIVGIDVRRPSTDLPGTVFHQADVRHSITDILRQYRIESVVHTAFIVQPLRDTALAEDTNVNGSKNVFACCKAAEVSHFVHLSSATVYGFHLGSPTPFTEDQPLRANTGFVYGKQKQQIEEHLIQHFQHGSPLITVVRPSFLAGSAGGNPLLHYLSRRLAFLPRRTAPLQLTHMTDIVEIIRLLLLKRIPGVFNAGAEGALTVDEMCEKLRTIAVHIPYGALSACSEAAWRCRLSLAPGPSWAMQLLRHSWVVSSERLTRETGHVFRHTTRATFEDFAARVLWQRR